MLEQVIDQVFSHPQIHVFGEFLSLPNINSINAKMLATLQLFAYGTFPDFEKDQTKFISLKPPQLQKLKLITLASIASGNSVVNYSELMQKT